MLRNRYQNFRIGLLSFAACFLSIAQPANAQQFVGTTQIFPSNSIFNTPITNLPVDKNSAKYVSSLGSKRFFHPDFDALIQDGIPFNIVTGVPNTTITFDYASESDPGPYPAVSTATTAIEGDDWSSANRGDRHVLLVNTTNNTLYELYDARFDGMNLLAGSGAIWNLGSNALRPNTWTSADAAGLPMMPLLVNYNEAFAGPIKHAFRLTGNQADGYIWPARHLITPEVKGAPPFGQRFRLKSSFNVSAAPSTAAKNVAIAFQQYGIIFADIGSDWYVTGCYNSGWQQTDLNFLETIQGSDWEAVDESALMVSPDSGAASTAVKAGIPPSTSAWPKVK